MGLIVEEMIERLTCQIGCKVEFTLEIETRKEDGFDDSTIRTISENGRTLKFEGYGLRKGESNNIFTSLISKVKWKRVNIYSY